MTEAPPSEPGGWAGLPLRARAGLVFGLALVVHGALQSLIPAFADVDAWFHSRFSEMLWNGETPWHGLEFPWMAHSSHAEFPTDWQWGWHWFVAPFAGLLGAVPGTKAATAVFAAVLTVASYAFLDRRGVAWPSLWTALLFLGNPYWLYRAHTARPTTLVLAALLLLLHQVLERRPRAAAACALIPVLLYAVPGAPVAVIGAGALAVAIRDREIPWKTAIAACAGIGVGILLHPGFWRVEGGMLTGDRALFGVWEQINTSVQSALAGGTAIAFDDGLVLRVDVPVELRSPTAQTLALQFWVPLAATLAAVIGVLRSWRGGRAFALTLLACVWFVATLRIGRLMEYWTPFAVLAAAVAWGGPAKEWAGMRVRAVVAVGALAVANGVFILGGGAFRTGDAIDWKAETGAELERAVRSIENTGEDRDTVFHPSWDEFAPLFHWNPDVRWTTGFDPWFLVTHDREKFKAIHHIVAGDLPPDALRLVLTKHFESRWVLLWRRPFPDGSGRRGTAWAVLEQQLDDADWATVVYDEPEAVVYRLEK